MNIQYVKGDLVAMAHNGEVGAVAHGCNCFHTMGSGIAPKLNELTEGKLLEADRETSYGDINKLGEYSKVVHNGVEIYNLYTQFVYGGQVNAKDLCYVSWRSVSLALCKLFETTEANTIAIPYVGCGLAGGSIEDFKTTIDICERLFFRDTDKTLLVVEFDPTV